MVNVEKTGPDSSPVESDVHRDNVLPFVDVVLDAASPISVDKVALARRVRVPIETVVTTSFGPATVRAEARTRRLLVEPRDVNHHSCPFGRVDERRGGEVHEGGGRGSLGSR